MCLPIIQSTCLKMECLLSALMDGVPIAPWTARLCRLWHCKTTICPGSTQGVLWKPGLCRCLTFRASRFQNHTRYRQDERVGGTYKVWYRPINCYYNIKLELYNIFGDNSKFKIFIFWSSILHQNVCSLRLPTHKPKRHCYILIKFGDFQHCQTTSLNLTFTLIKT